VAARALELARHHGEHGYEAMALRTAGATALARGDAAGEDTLRAVLIQAQHLGMQPLLVECHLAVAAARARAGDTDTAATHRAAATTIIDAIGMRPPPPSFGV
jgi:hypothetical protein